MMMRTLTAFAALTASVALAGAASAEDVHVKIAGKTAAAAYASIEAAAKRACLPAADQAYSIYLSSPCVAETIDATLAKIGDPALLQYSQARKTFLVASN